MLGISLTAGHVLNSGLAVPYLALAVGVHMSTRKRKA